MYTTTINTISLAAGIDGPAAFLASEAPDTAMTSQPQSQNWPQQSQSPSLSPTCVEAERDGDTETLLQETKTDIHQLLQKQGDCRRDSNVNATRSATALDE